MLDSATIAGTPFGAGFDLGGVDGFTLSQSNGFVQHRPGYFFWRGFHNWDLKEEGRPFANFGLDSNPAFVQLNKVLADVQPQASPLVLIDFALDLRELLEQEFLVGRGDTPAGVDDLGSDMIVRMRQFDGNAAFFRKTI